MKTIKTLALIIWALTTFSQLSAQNKYELNSGWKAMPSSKVEKSGEELSVSSYSVSEWQKAVVPGTVLTTQLENKEIPDPFYGMNNEDIPDIYNTGREYYTYWFVKDFEERSKAGEQVWLTFRGINYACDIFLNGEKVNREEYEGMFLRKTVNITSLLSKDGKNRLAVIVYPPYEVGNPNGGQGGDGRIAKNLTHQYVAGWDWIKPIRDRNTGIWDKVFIEKTGGINLKNPHVVTLVPNTRKTSGKQEPAILKVSAELENSTNKRISGILRYSIAGERTEKAVTVEANSTKEVALDEFALRDPKLWWPSGYGEQHLYDMRIEFLEGNKPSDYEDVKVGVREIQTYWNPITRSKEVAVNGQKVFIKGGNWIISDAMLRFSKDRYDHEIRYHRDMNLNLIRIWGGALTERPEFYEACDKYGILVMQDFWFSGDCNGRWEDPRKAEDQWTRRKYPDNHKLALEAAEDMIKMIRNHPSLAMWCGGNEITPPSSILIPLRDEILPRLDGTRWLADYSNSDEMSFNFKGGNGDGPYGIQNRDVFWNERTWPFNSEVGSVGLGDFESITRFIPEGNLTVPKYDPDARPRETVDSVWQYHTYIGYGNHIEPYGTPTDVKDFAMKAQLVNYDQYRALAEGFSSRMWEWYTGFIIWKTQNPWTSMRGQMYDCYLDPNACLYGLRNGSEPVHIMVNPTTHMVMVTNNAFDKQYDLMTIIKAYDINGKETHISQVFTYMEPSTSKNISSIGGVINRHFKEKGGFLLLELQDENQKPVSRNLYWYPDEQGEYSGLKEMQKAKINFSARRINKDKIEVTITNPANNPVAFFNRIALIDTKTKERILPSFYDDNYLSVMPGESRSIIVDYVSQDNQSAGVQIYGWNVDREEIAVP